MKLNYKHFVYRLSGLAAILLFILQIAGCGTLRHGRYYGKDGPPPFNVDVSKIPDAVPKIEPRSKYGNPPSYIVKGHRYYVRKTSIGFEERGIASWYGMKFHKQRTSSGEPYNLLAMTAAHRTLPLPTYVLVTNLQNGRHVIVKVNDRGPFADNRIMDLSYVAAKKLGIVAHGTGLVDIKAIDPHHPNLVLGQLSSTYVSTKPTSISHIVNHPGAYHPRLYLQLGAFADKANAHKLESKLYNYSRYPVFIKPGTHNGHAIYRVQIGPIPSVEASDALVSKIEHAGLGRPITAID